MKRALFTVMVLALCACSRGDVDQAAPVPDEAPVAGDTGEEPAEGETLEPRSTVGGIPARPEPQRPAPTGAGDQAAEPPMARKSADAGAALAPAVDSGCVTDCVAREQMRAVSPEVIEADCRRECAD